MWIKRSERETVRDSHLSQVCCESPWEVPAQVQLRARGSIFSITVNTFLFLSASQKLLVRSFERTKITFLKCSSLVSLHLAFSERSCLPHRALQMWDFPSTEKECAGHSERSWLPLLLRAIPRHAGNDSDILRAAQCP